MKNEKYTTVRICPVIIYGSSTGRAPIHVSKINVLVNIHIIILFIGYIEFLWNFPFIENGKVNNMRIDIINANTPPNFLGIDRRIAYANKKYHSGWMWIGVTIGFAGEKFSGSMVRNGFKLIHVENIIIVITIPKISLIEKYGWKGILSMLFFIPRGFEEPDSWRKIKCVIIKIDRIKGKMKWNEKNRFRVGLSTAKPPHIHLTNISPIYGMAEIKFVITVAPQNDIWPHGSTYPKNAVAIKVNIINVPEIQVFFNLNDP